MGLLSMLFGDKSLQVKEALENGGAIVDVRTPEEFSFGRIDGSINIPLDQLERKMGKIKKLKQPLVLCCESGSRSGSAKMLLKSKGIENVLNGGSWNKLDSIKAELK